MSLQLRRLIGSLIAMVAVCCGVFEFHVYCREATVTEPEPEVTAQSNAAMNPHKLAESQSRSARHFSRTEEECLIRLYKRIVDRPTEPNTRGRIDLNTFMNTLHKKFTMMDDMMTERVFCVFDKDNDSYISEMEWIEGMSVFLRGTLDEKIKYCFEVYDLNGDGYISREEMFHFLKDSLPKNPTEEDPYEDVKDLVEIALNKMDYDHDDKLSYEDFDKTIREENLLLEAFAPCLPDSKSILAFEKETFAQPKEL